MTLANNAHCSSVGSPPPGVFDHYFGGVAPPKPHLSEIGVDVGGEQPHAARQKYAGGDVAEPAEARPQKLLLSQDAQAATVLAWQLQLACRMVSFPIGLAVGVFGPARVRRRS